LIMDKKMKVKNLKGQTVEELKQLCEDTQKELSSLRMKRGTGTIEQPLRLRTLRRDVARIKTAIRELGVK